MRPFLRIYISLAIATSLLMAGCSRHHKGIEAVVLLDYSASVPKKEFDKYVGMLREGVFRNMTFDDHIVLIPIHKASVMKNEIIGQCDFSELKEPLSENIPQWAVLHEADTIRARFDAVKDTLFQSRIYSLREELSQFNIQTDIIGSINQAYIYLTRAKRRWKVLFIFSDMIQESEEVNLKHLHTTKMIQQKIQRLEEMGQIPDLEGTFVFICGATERSKRQYQLNKRFWYLFFEKAKASVYDYGYHNHDRIGPFLRDLRKGRLE